MKLVSLNIWGGKAYEPLMKFIKKSAPTTDIFCFQEVFESPASLKERKGTRINILADLKGALTGFETLSAPIGGGYTLDGPVDLDVTESNTTFVKRDAIPKIESSGAVFIHDTFRKLLKNEAAGDVPNNFLYTRFSHDGKKFVVCNIHCISQPGDKLDTPDRIRQSQIIKDFLEKESGAKIICGDFNLLPETKSIKILENAGLINLISKFKIERTRSRLSSFYGKPDFQKFADYTFVSQGVNVLNFSAPDVDISDHLPMVLEFS